MTGNSGKTGGSPTCLKRVRSDNFLRTIAFYVDISKRREARTALASLSDNQRRSHAMRVIAGAAHGRKLTAPSGLATRPTLARVRQSIFSRLEARMNLTGLIVLDLFSGTGSLGIEALSRGAAHVTFVEAARPALSALSRNLTALGLAERARVMKADVFEALEKLAAEGTHFDLVLSDPPYRRGFGDPVMSRLVEHALLAPDAWVATEVSRLEQAPDSRPGLQRVSLAALGDHQIALYQPTRGER